MMRMPLWEHMHCVVVGDVPSAVRHVPRDIVEVLNVANGASGRH